MDAGIKKTKSALAAFRANLGLFGLMACLMTLATPICLYADTIVKLRDNVVVQEGTEVDSAVSLGGNVQVNGSVREDAVSLGGSVFLGPNAVVRGDVVSLGGSVVKQEGARVDGETTVVDASSMFRNVVPSPRDWWQRPFLVPSVPSVFPFIGVLALALLTVALAPRLVESISSAVEHGPVGSFFWGVLGSVSILPIAFMLVISIVGIILIPFEMLAAGICFFLGYVAVSRLVGRKILLGMRIADKPMILETFIGAAILWLVSMVPLLGWLFISCAMVIGFGGVIVTAFRRIAWGRQPGSQPHEPF